MKRILTVILSVIISVCSIPAVTFANVTYSGDCEIGANVYKIPNEAGVYTYYFTPEEEGIYAVYLAGRQRSHMTYKMYEEKNGSFVQLDASGQNAGGDDSIIKVYKTADCNFYTYKAGVRYKVVVTSDGDNQLTDFQIKRLDARCGINIIATDGGYLARDLYMEADDDLEGWFPSNYVSGRSDFKKAVDIDIVDTYTALNGEGIVVKAMGGYEFVGFFLEDTDIELFTSQRQNQPFEPDRCYHLRTSPDEVGDMNYIEARFKKIGGDDTAEELRTQQLSGTNTYNKIVGDAPFSLDVKTSGDGTFSYSSNNSAVAAVNSSGVVSIMGEGTAVITVTASKTNQYQEAKKQVTINVTGKKPQILSGTTLYNKIVGDPDFQLNIKSNGSGKLSYTSENSSVVSVSVNGMVSVRGAGSTRIKVRAEKTDNYNVAEIYVAVTVKQKEVTVDTVSGFEVLLDKNNNKISYVFQELNDCAGYKIFYSYDSVEWRILEEVLTTEGTVSVSSLKKGRRIYLKVQAYKLIDGETVHGNDSEILTVRRVSTPTLKIQKLNRTKIKLSWKSSASANGYEIYRKVGSGTYKKISNTSNNSYINKKLKKGKTYYYYIKPYQFNDNGIKVFGTKTAVKRMKV